MKEIKDMEIYGQLPATIHLPDARLNTCVIITIKARLKTALANLFHL
jgi:hypothetical protein